MRHRKDFCWTAECGVYVCVGCGTPFYPMELDYAHGIGNCPDCGAHCERATAEELATHIATSLAAAIADNNGLAAWQYEVIYDRTLLGFTAWQAQRWHNPEEPPLRDLELP